MWIAKETEAIDDGAIGGDAQAGTAWSRRFVWDSPITLPPGEMAGINRVVYAVIDDAWYASQPDHDTEDETGEYDVTNQTDYYLCADPEDVGGTEYDSAREYNYVGDMAYTLEDAEATAHRCANRAAPDDYTWNPEESPKLSF